MPYQASAYCDSDGDGHGNQYAQRYAYGIIDGNANRHSFGHTQKYGDANAEVRRIMKVRSGWIDKMRWLHKSIAR